MMLKGGKVQCTDGVPANLVKYAAKSFTKPLIMIFTASVAKGKYMDTC